MLQENNQIRFNFFESCPERRKPSSCQTGDHARSSSSSYSCSSSSSSSSSSFPPKRPISLASLPRSTRSPIDTSNPDMTSPTPPATFEPTLLSFEKNPVFFPSSFLSLFSGFLVELLLLDDDFLKAG